MARPERNNVDYFPFLCKEGKAMFFIEQTYGNDGYATWVKILRQLAVTNYHFLNMNDDIELMFLASKCKITTEKLTAIVDDLCKLNEFNLILWRDYKIIYNAKFIESISDAYLNRKNKCITFEGLLQHLLSLCIVKPTDNLVKSISNTQTILKETKEEKTILKETKEFCENEKKYFSISGKIESGTPIEFVFKNHKTLIESNIMNFGNGIVTLEKFEENYKKHYPNGMAFDDRGHLTNSIKSTIVKLTENKNGKNNRTNNIGNNASFGKF
jgi:hypothetical protein